MPSTLNSTSNMWWIGPLVLTGLRLLTLEARLAHAKAKGGLLLFTGTAVMRLLWACVIVGFTVGIVLSIGREETWILALAAALVLFGCLTWPATISIGPDGVRRHLWWRRAIFIPWGEVSGIQKNQGGDIDVFGKYGQDINFTRFHTDPFRFETEVKWRAKLDKTISASASPAIR